VKRLTITHDRLKSTVSPEWLVIGAALLLGLGVLASKFLVVAGIMALFAAGVCALGRSEGPPHLEA
jgi:hypothetical protein